jgi:hypothetical protein
MKKRVAIGEGREFRYDYAYTHRRWHSNPEQSTQVPILSNTVLSIVEGREDGFNTGQEISTSFS